MAKLGLFRQAAAEIGAPIASGKLLLRVRHELSFRRRDVRGIGFPELRGWMKKYLSGVARLVAPASHRIDTQGQKCRNTIPGMTKRMT